MQVAVSRVTGGSASIDFVMDGFDDAVTCRIPEAFRDVSGGPMGDAMGRAGDSYMLDTRIRFGQQAQGGGEWPDLSIVTKIKRLYKMGIKAGRLGRGQGLMRQLAESYKLLILVDTTHLFVSLIPGQPDNIKFPYPDGIAVGTSTPYANFHQSGGPRLPMRRILVNPSDPTMPEGSLNRIAGLLTDGTRETIVQAIAG